MVENEINLMDLRKRVINGDPVTPEEYAIIVENLRRDRTAGKVAKASKAAKKDPVKTFGADLSNLLDTEVAEE